MSPVIRWLDLLAASTLSSVVVPTASSGVFSGIRPSDHQAREDPGEHHEHTLSSRNRRRSFFSIVFCLAECDIFFCSWPSSGDRPVVPAPPCLLRPTGRSFRRRAPVLLGSSRAAGARAARTIILNIIASRNLNDAPSCPRRTSIADLKILSLASSDPPPEGAFCLSWGRQLLTVVDGCRRPASSLPLLLAPLAAGSIIHLKGRVPECGYAHPGGTPPPPPPASPLGYLLHTLGSCKLVVGGSRNKTPCSARSNQTLATARRNRHLTPSIAPA